MSTVATPEQKLKRNIRRTVIILAVIITTFLSLFFHKLMTPRVLSNQELMVNGAVVFDKPRIIKDFSLVDHTGNAFDLPRLQGHWTIIFFGFTSCPDICPTTLATLSQWYKKLDSDIQKQTQVVLVSLDPARDTPEVLQKYMSHFNGDFIGVTGEFLTIKRLTDQLNVAFAKVALGDDYTIDHSSHIVLMNPYGHYHGIFKPPFELARLKLTFQSIVSSFNY